MATPKSDVLHYWDCNQLDEANKKSPLQTRLRHLKRHLNWYGRIALKSKEVRHWTVFDLANSVMTISTYYGYKNSTVKQKVADLQRVLIEKGIYTIRLKQSTFNTKIRQWIRLRQLGLVLFILQFFLNISRTIIRKASRGNCQTGGLHPV